MYVHTKATGRYVGTGGKYASNYAIRILHVCMCACVCAYMCPFYVFRSFRNSKEGRKILFLFAEMFLKSYMDSWLIIF